MPPRRRRRGYIETLTSGSFRAVVYTGIDPLAGLPRYIRETTESYDDAEQALPCDLERSCGRAGFTIRTSR